jgi:hypothetical protein
MFTLLFSLMKVMQKQATTKLPSTVYNTKECREVLIMIAIMHPC